MSIDKTLVASIVSEHVAGYFADPWQQLEARAFDQLLQLRKANGHVRKPSPGWLSKLVSDMPNHYLAAIKSK